MNFSTIFEYLYNHLDFVISACSALVFLIVNIIQFFRTKDIKLLKKVINDIPNIIRQVEEISTNLIIESGTQLSTTAPEYKAMYKKSLAESLLINKYGKKFVYKNIGVLDDSIEDILNTPQKKGGSYELSKKDEEK